MRIAVVSDYGLPDARVEKEIITLRKYGHEIVFVGPFRKTILAKNEGFKRFYLEWDRYSRLGFFPYYGRLKRKLSKILSTINPDVVLAINIFAGIMVHELGYHMVLDDHELYSFEIRFKEDGKRLIDRIIEKRKVKLYAEWENKISVEHPVVVVSNNMKRYYMEKGAKKVYVVKNYPALYEVKTIAYREVPCGNRIFAYIGGDISVKKTIQYRNLKETIKILKLLYERTKSFELIVIGDKELSSSEFIKSLGYLDHTEIYNILARVHYGILSWAPSRYHKICSLNKAYLYSHSGAIPIFTSSLEEMINEYQGLAIQIEKENFNENLLLVYENLLNMNCNELNERRKSIFNFSRKNLIWEKQENDLLRAIKNA